MYLKSNILQQMPYHLVFNQYQSFLDIWYYCPLWRIYSNFLCKQVCGGFKTGLSRWASGRVRREGGGDWHRISCNPGFFLTYHRVENNFSLDPLASTTCIPRWQAWATILGLLLSLAAPAPTWPEIFSQPLQFSLCFTAIMNMFDCSFVDSLVGIWCKNC